MSEEKPVSYKYKQLFRWNIDDDAYKPSIAVYENGAVEIVVGGHGIGTSIEKIFEHWKEIDRLKAQNEKMREALEKLESKECDCYHTCGPCFDILQSIAIEALRGE